MAKGRRDRRIEFFRLLAEILECDRSYPQFANRIGKKVPNVHTYFKAALIPGLRFLRSAMRHAFEWEVTPILEVEPVSETRRLTTGPGVYCLYDSSGSAI